MEINHWKSDVYVSERAAALADIYDAMLAGIASMEYVNQFDQKSREMTELIALSDVLPENLKASMIRETNKIAAEFTVVTKQYMRWMKATNK